MSSLSQDLGILVGGEFVARDSADHVRAVVDPARDTIIATVPEASISHVDRAVHQAREAFDRQIWAGKDPWERGSTLLAIATEMRHVHDELAALESLNVGKPIAQARGDVHLAIQIFDYYGRVIVDYPTEVIEDGPEQLTFVTRVPVGVVAAIVPWNYPLAIAATAVAPALAMGCSVVLKPSELTPLTALRLGEIASKHLPAGVLSVIPGDGPTIGSRLAIHDEIDQIVFTGGTETGRHIMRSAAADVKRIGLELGGKSPTIVLADAPVQASVADALQRIVLNQGENCGAGSRLLVHESRYDEFVDRLVDAAARVTIGDPQDEATTLGPMISATHSERVRSYMTVAAKECQEIFVGETPSERPLVDGFFAPLSIWEAKPGGKIWREEVFGPLLAVTRFSEEDEAVTLANDSVYGLMASIWAGDRGDALRVSRRLRVGSIRINQASPPLHGPWGGFKHSGLGRSQGRYGLERSSELKQISVNLTAM